MEKKPIDQLPHDLERLGEPGATFRPGISSLIIKFAIAALVLLVGGFFVVDPWMDDRVSQVAKRVFALIGTVIILFGAYFAWSTVQQCYFRVLVYPDALVRVDRRDYAVVRWDEITTIWEGAVDIHFYGPKVATTRKFKIQTVDGDKFAFDSDLKKVADLGQILQGQVTPRLLTAAMKAIHDGDAVPFGRIAVSAEGMRYGTSTLPWNELEPINLDKGFLKIRQKRKWTRWYKVRISEFPNLFVFLGLVNKIGGA